MCKDYDNILLRGGAIIVFGKPSVLKGIEENQKLKDLYTVQEIALGDNPLYEATLDYKAIFDAKFKMNTGFEIFYMLKLKSGLKK